MPIGNDPSLDQQPELDLTIPGLDSPAPERTQPSYIDEINAGLDATFAQADVAKADKQAEQTRRRMMIEKNPALAISGYFEQETQDLNRYPTGVVKPKLVERVQVTPAERVYAAMRFAEDQSKNQMDIQKGDRLYFAKKSDPTGLIELQENVDLRTAMGRIAQEERGRRGVATDADYMAVGRFLAQQKIAQQSPRGVLQGAADVAMEMPRTILPYLLAAGTGLTGLARGTGAKAGTAAANRGLSAGKARGIGAIGAEAMAATSPMPFQLGDIAANTVERMLPSVGLDDSTKDGLRLVISDPRTNFAPALLKAAKHQFIENLSEQSGEWMGKAGSAIKATIAKKIVERGGIPAAEKLMATVAESGWVKPFVSWVRDQRKTNPLVSHIYEAAQQNGIPLEMLEEEVANAFHTLTGEQPSDTPGALALQGKWMPALKALATEALGFAAMPLYAQANRAAIEQWNKTKVDEALNKETAFREQISMMRAARERQQSQPQSQWSDPDVLQSVIDQAGPAATAYATAPAPSRSALKRSELDIALKNLNLYDKANNEQGRTALWDALRSTLQGSNQTQMDERQLPSVLGLPQNESGRSIAFDEAGNPAITWDVNTGDGIPEQATIRMLDKGWELSVPSETPGQPHSMVYQRFDEAYDVLRGSFNIAQPQQEINPLNARNAAIVNEYMNRVGKARRSGMKPPKPTQQEQAAMDAVQQEQQQTPQPEPQQTPQAEVPVETAPPQQPQAPIPTQPAPTPQVEQPQQTPPAEPVSTPPVVEQQPQPQPQPATTIDDLEAELEQSDPASLERLRKSAEKYKLNDQAYESSLRVAIDSAKKKTETPAETAFDGREPWQITREEYAREWSKKPASGGFAARSNYKIAKAYHRKLVEDAIAAGKPVPPEVMADYPDLKPPETKPAPAQPEQVAPPQPQQQETPNVEVQRQGRTEGQVTHQPTAPAGTKKQGESSQQKPPTYRDWRWQQGGKNFGTIRPNKVGAKFTSEQVNTLVEWVRSIGLTPSGQKDENGIKVTGDPSQRLDLSKHGAAGVKQEKQDAKSSEQKQADQDRKQQKTQEAESRESRPWIVSTFGKDAMNAFNSSALSDFLEGRSKKFEGQLNQGWRDGLQSIGAIGSDGSIDWKKIKDAYDQDKETPKQPAPPPAEPPKSTGVKVARVEPTTKGERVGTRGTRSIPGLEDAAREAEERDERRSKFTADAEHLAETFNGDVRDYLKWIDELNSGVNAAIAREPSSFEDDLDAIVDDAEKFRPQIVSRGEKRPKKREDQVEWANEWILDRLEERIKQKQQYGKFKVGDKIAETWNSYPGTLASFQLSGWDVELVVDNGNGKTSVAPYSDAALNSELEPTDESLSPKVVTLDKAVEMGLSHSDWSTAVENAYRKNQIDEESEVWKSYANPRVNPYWKAFEGVPLIGKKLHVQNQRGDHVVGIGVSAFISQTNLPGIRIRTQDGSEILASPDKVDELSAWVEYRQKRGKSVPKDILAFLNEPTEPEQPDATEQGQVEQGNQQERVEVGPRGIPAETSVGDRAQQSGEKQGEEGRPLWSMTLEDYQKRPDYNRDRWLASVKDAIVRGEQSLTKENRKLFFELADESLVQEVIGSPKPWVNVSVEDEAKWFGTKVKVTPTRKYQDPFTGTVVRVLNGGKTVEVKPDGTDSTFRVDSDSVTILELKVDERPSAKSVAEPTGAFTVTREGNLQVDFEKLSAPVLHAARVTIEDQNARDRYRYRGAEETDALKVLAEQDDKYRAFAANTPELDEQISKLNSASNAANSLKWNKQSRYDSLVNQKKSNIAAKLGVPNQSKAAKWAGKWRQAEADAKKLPEVVALKRELDAAIADDAKAEEALKAAKYRRSIEENRQAIEHYGIVPAGTIKVSASNPNIAIRVGEFDKELQQYQVDYGSESRGEFYKTSGGGNASPEVIARNYVTLEEAEQARVVRTELDSAIELMKERRKEEAKRKDKENRKEQIAQRNAAVRPDYSGMTVTPLRAVDADTRIPVADKNMLTNGKWLVRKDRLPPKVASDLEAAIAKKDYGKYSEENPLKKEVTDSIFGQSKAEDLKTVEFLGVETVETEYGNKERALFVDDAGTIYGFPAESMAYFDKHGVFDEFKAHMTGKNNNEQMGVLFKNGKPVAVIAGLSNVEKVEDLDAKAIRERVGPRPFKGLSAAPSETTKPKPKSRGKKQSGGSAGVSYSAGLKGDPQKIADTMQRLRSQNIASWAGTEPTTPTGRQMIRLIDKAVKKGVAPEVSMGIMTHLIGDAMNAQIAYMRSQVPGKAGGVHHSFGSMIYMRTPGSTNVEWHEMGHHLSVMLADAVGARRNRKGGWIAKLLGDQHANTLLLLTDSSNAPDGTSAASDATVEEAFAEYIRRYVMAHNTLTGQVGKMTQSQRVAFAKMHEKMQEVLQKHLPEVLAGIKDAHRFYAKFSSLPLHVQMAASQKASLSHHKGLDNIRKKIKTAMPRLIGAGAWTDQLANEVFRGAFTEAIEQGMTKSQAYDYARKYRRDLLGDYADKQGYDQGNTPHNLRLWTQQVDATAQEASFALNGGAAVTDKSGNVVKNDGIRFKKQFELEWLEPNEDGIVPAIEELKAVGVDTAPLEKYRTTRIGDNVYLANFSILKEVVDPLAKKGLEEKFAAYVAMRALAFRYRQHKNKFPNTDGYTGEMLDFVHDEYMAEIDKMEKEHPEFVTAFAKQNEYANQLALLKLFTGEQTADQIATYIASHQEMIDGKRVGQYAPLPRNMENNLPTLPVKQGAGSGGLDIKIGSHRAHGSLRPVLPLRDAYIRNVSAHYTALMNSQLANSMAEFQKEAGKSRGGRTVDIKTRLMFERMMLPVAPNVKRVATLLQGDLERTRGEQMDESASQEAINARNAANTHELLRIIAEDISDKYGIDLDPYDISIEQFGGLPIYRAVKPAGRVYTWFDPRTPGQAKMYLVLDDSLAMMLDYSTHSPEGTIQKAATVFAAASAPIKKNVVKTVSFVMKNIPRDAVYQMLSAESSDWKQSFVPLLNMAIAFKAMQQGEAFDAQTEAQLISRALLGKPREKDDTWAERLRDHLVSDFERSMGSRIEHAVIGMDEATRLAAGFAQAISAVLQMPMTLATAPMAMTGLAEKSETTPRMGAYIRAKKMGASDLQAWERMKVSSGNFSQKALGPLIRSLDSAGMFINPSKQATYGIFRGLFDADPKVRAFWMARTGAVGFSLATAMGALAVALIKAMPDDDREETERWISQRNREQADAMGFIPIPSMFGKKVTMVQFPFMEGIAGMIQSYMFNSIVNARLGGKEDIYRATNRLMSKPAGTVESLLPHHLKIVREQVENWDYFRNRNIESKALQQRSPEKPYLRFYPGTDPEMYVYLAEKLKFIGPQRLRHLIEGVAGREVTKYGRLFERAKEGTLGETSVNEIPGVGSLTFGEYEGFRAHSVQNLIEQQRQYKALNDQILTDMKFGLDTTNDEKILIKLGGAIEARERLDDLWTAINDERMKDKPDRDKIAQLERQMTDLAIEFETNPDAFAEKYLNDRFKAMAQKLRQQVRPGSKPEYKQQIQREKERARTVIPLLKAEYDDRQKSKGLKSTNVTPEE